MFAPYLYLEKPGREARLTLGNYYEIESFEVLDSISNSIVHQDLYGILDSVRSDTMFIKVIEWKTKYKLEGKTTNRDKVYFGQGRTSAEQIDVNKIHYISRTLDPIIKANRIKKLGYSSLSLLTGTTTSVVSIFLNDKKEKRRVLHAGLIQMTPFVGVFLFHKTQKRYYLSGDHPGRIWDNKKIGCS